PPPLTDPLSLHDALPILIGSWAGSRWIPRAAKDFDGWIGSGARSSVAALRDGIKRFREAGGRRAIATNIPVDLEAPTAPMPDEGDRKSTRLNSSHVSISY